jgi:hypothetical protein
MAFLSHEDTTNDMAECFTEEFMRMGYNHKQVLALFHNPQYLGPHMAFEKRGEPFIRDLIAAVFARWGKTVTWPDGRTGSPLLAATLELSTTESERRARSDTPYLEPFEESQNPVTSAATTEVEETLTDPMGSPIPKLNV